MTVKEIGGRIREIRLEKELTLQDIAEAIGVARSTVQRYEAGQIENIKLPVIEAIARCLGVDPKWLLGKSKTRDGDAADGYDGNMSANPDIRMIARAGKKLSPEQAEQLRKYAQFMFPEAFE